MKSRQMKRAAKIPTPISAMIPACLRTASRDREGAASRSIAFPRASGASDCMYEFSARKISPGMYRYPYFFRNSFIMVFFLFLNIVSIIISQIAEKIKGFRHQKRQGYLPAHI